jgi:galactokinase
MKLSEFKRDLENNVFNSLFEEIYGKAIVSSSKTRYVNCLESFSDAFKNAKDDIAVISTPGRTEIGGNHTDHNAGFVLAAAINLDILSIASKNTDNVIRLNSEGYAPVEMPLDDLSPREEERSTPVSLIRGVAARMKEFGYDIGGFDSYTTSLVPDGSGLSSSAAFEVQIASILNHLYNGGRLDNVTNARISQYAENDYFGKPCGLMDQTTCAVGGLLQIDFRDFNNPVIEPVEFDFANAGHVLYIVNTGGSHSDLTEDYTALENEMKETARLLGQPVLRFTSKEALFANLKNLRENGNDRAILRAYHYFNDNERVIKQTASLKKGDFGRFKELIIESGLSSFMYCQNIYANSNWREQGLAIGLMIAEELLAGKGAWRVHGGGFAGTIQAFVPENIAIEFEQRMGAIFGEDACHRALIRPKGTLCVAK